MPNDTEIVVLVTTASTEEAEKIAADLLDKKLSACVNILPGMRSMYLWEGKRCEENEVLMMIKSRMSLFSELETTIKTHHSYSLCEIIALPIVAGSEDYLQWIRDSTKA